MLAIWKTQATQSSAEQRAPRPSVSLRQPTPLYDNLIAYLERGMQQHPDAGGFIEYLTQCCFFDQLLTMDSFGQLLERPLPLAVKMEELLRTARRERERILQKLQQPSSSNVRIESEDMIEMWNEWRKDVRSYMHHTTFATYEKHLRNGKSQKAHQLGKQAFSTYLFQLSGCKFLLHKLIELPIIAQSMCDDVDQPVLPSIVALIRAYEDHKTTPQYENAVARSAKHQSDQKRLSHQIWWAQYNYTQGRKLSEQVRDGVVDFWDLAPEKQKLVEDFDSRRSARTLDKLLLQKRPHYRGAAAELTG